MTPPAMLPFCSAAPTPCSPFSPPTSSAHPGARALRRVETSALRSHADPLLAQAVPDRADSSILSPYAATPDDIARGFSAAADLPTSSDTILYPHLTPVSAAADDAVQRALLDAPIPTAFPADASEAEESFARFVDNLSRQIFQAEDRLTEGYDRLRLSAYDALGAYRRALRGVAVDLKTSLRGVTGDPPTSSSVGAAKEQATDVSGAFQDKLAGAGAVAADVLRKAIVLTEDSVGTATASLVYYYGSAKSSLPPNVKGLLNSSEEKASLVLRPIGSALQQVYVIIEGVEKNVGLDPSDPIVQLAVLLGGSTTIGISYWLFAYGGYSGDLTPESTLELLKNDGKAVLIDVRPEDLRVKDGIPDLRRAARSKYASVASPEINRPTKNLLKGGSDVDDALIAVVIRNLKLVKGDSKVIIMDANGTRSKSIARLLKKLGVQQPYLVKGGFQSWAKNLRVKELKPETVLTALNEDAEEIFEGIKPTPTFVVGSLLGLSAATYALLEWETTLQYVGVLSLGLTIYVRFSSYEGSEDFQQDLKLLFSPVRVGAEALSWAAKKLEPSKIGLATSPSTTAVQDRVLQAAAKHESKPSDAEESSAKADSFASEA
ncbi:uncharacterized protein LOC124659490 [Lolium rigidum]|uniref:uncharacterized protein LOC124659490 n=1 Tax=Lolium rigidum TaxID=89674 RepID=UPI001F5CCB06|nr:uncharacterized protein LOC124659490 [Lolium rigidum]